MRLADKIVYSNQDFKKRPKEIHKKVLDVLEPFLNEEKFERVLDVGCANGNFLFLLKEKFFNRHKLKLSGLDVHRELLDIAKLNMPEIDVYCDSITTFSSPANSHDIVTCLGVMSIFDDFSIPFEKLYSLVRPGGVIVITSEFNNYPVDVITRYKLSNSNETFQSGWNIFSRKTVEGILESKVGLKYKWIDFEMPFAIPPSDDPMRAWTISTEFKKHQQINGAQQLVNQSILLIVRGSN